MKIVKFKDYIKENVEATPSITLEYMAFDWDNNILNMSTKIHMDHLIDGVWTKEDVSTEKFATVRNDKTNWRVVNNSGDEAFSEFRDDGPRGDEAFLEDTKESIAQKKFAPSWNKFIDTLINGHIFAIITARGHNGTTLRSGVEYIINEYLTDNQRIQMIESLRKYQNLFGGDIDSEDELISQYLDNCMFFGVSSPDFEKIAPGGASNPEKGKEIALSIFTKKMHEFGKMVNAKKVQLSFSDDDIRNVDHIEKYMRNELSLKYYMQYNVFDTSSGTDSRRIKVTEKKNNDIKKFGEQKVNMYGYPTIKEVEDATYNQILTWWRHLPSPGKNIPDSLPNDEFKNAIDRQAEVMNLISDKFKGGEGFTPNSSKSIGW